MDNFTIWDTFSMAWTEVGLDDQEIVHHAKVLKEQYPNWDYIDSVVTRDVCGSFATESCGFLLVLIPIIGWMLISPWSDWGYSEEYLRTRMKKWTSQPMWINYLNPIYLIGYPLAIHFVSSLKRKLKRAFDEN